MIGDQPLTRDDLVVLLNELGAELHRQGLRGEMFVVGGAAMALAYNTRRATRDVDGVFEPKAALYRAAAVVGGHHHLHEGWLNDSVKGLLPGADPDALDLFDSPGISVSVPSPRYLLALKVAAARVDRDADDIRQLSTICGLTTAAQVLHVAERVIGAHHRFEPKVQFLIEELFSNPLTDPDKELPSQPSLSEQMRIARRSAGLSIAETARRAGTSRAAIHSYESGQVSPTLVTAIRVLSVCGCSLRVMTEE